MKDCDAWKDENNLRVKGVLQGLEEENMTPVFGPFVWSAAGAPVDDAVVDKLLGDLEKDFKNAGSIDGVAIMFHGATVTKTRAKSCWRARLARVRRRCCRSGVCRRA